MLLELCVASLDDALVAEQGGADRIELNSALSLGGLTPSLGLLSAVRAAISLPIIAMIRPRAGGFHYRSGEFICMQRDVDLTLSHGAEGIAFGILDEDGNIDLPRCRQIMRQAAGRPVVFHRAFDVVPDPAIALEQLIDLGIARVLTSGGAETAIAGAETIRRLREQAAGRIEILPGSGIRPHNVAALLAITGCEQIHASLSALGYDRSTQARPEIRFAVDPPPADRYRATDGQAVNAMRQALDAIAAR